MGQVGVVVEKNLEPKTRMPSGVPGFDEIADGGLPLGGVTVVLGGPGTGKTIFGMQVLTRSGDNNGAGVLVAFEESAGRILANLAGFSWGAASVDHVAILDAQLSESVEHGGEFDLLGMLAIVAAKAKQIGAARIVFDGLDVLLAYLGDSTLIRRESFRLRDWVHASGLTAIITAKAGIDDARAIADYDFLQFMADCVVTLRHRVVEGTALRHVRISKYRGAAHSSNELPFAITPDGIEIAENTSIGLGYPVSIERVSTGVERLDVMLSGGYYRGSSVLITGVPGTAKTSLAAAFAEAAAARGERTLYISFDEAPEQIVRNVASIGIQFTPHVESGMLRLYSLRGRAESPESQVARIRALLREIKPRNLVIDPLSALAQHGAGPTTDDAALQVLDLAKRAGITVVNTSLLGNPMPLTEQTPLNISTIADVWMHVSYVSQSGERNRALTIIKARGTGHSNQVRELILADTGVTLADVYLADGEVLMGTLRWEKENEMRRTRTAAANSAVLREQRAELALAQTKAQQHTLSRAQAIQEAELAQIKADTTTEVDRRAVEADELFVRRRADSTSPSLADLDETV
jgi:circadian clock protein KaiC